MQMEVEKIRPRVPLDLDMLKFINEFYSTKLSEKCCGVRCFSHPDLESHMCNVYFQIAGDKCKSCGNNPNRICEVTCNVHHICLAAFAFRVGIGGNDLYEAMIYNTRKLSFSKLFEAVMLKVKKVDEVEQTAQDLERLELQSKEEIEKEDQMRKDQKDVKETKKAEKPVKSAAKKEKPAKPEKKAVTPKKAAAPDPKARKSQKVPSSHKDETGNDLFTISEAAKFYGCSYFNMHVHLKKGHLNKVAENGKNFVRKTELEELMRKNGKLK